VSSFVASRKKEAPAAQDPAFDDSTC